MLRPRAGLSSTMSSRICPARERRRVLSSQIMRLPSAAANRVSGVLVTAATLAALAAAPSWAATPPRTASHIVATAEAEAKVVVYSATDRTVVAPLLADFAELYPGIAVEYHDMTSIELHERFIRE